MENSPVQIGDTHIKPGDWLIGDDSGLVCIPKEKIFQITEQALNLAKCKQELLEQINQMEDLEEEKAKELIHKYQNAYQQFTIHDE